MYEQSSATAAAVVPQVAITGEPGGAEYFSALKNKADEAIGSIYKTRITPIEFPAQGDFNWYWQNLNQIFNQGTFDFISARVSPGDIADTAQLSPAGGFPNAYIQVITALEYSLSSTESATLNKAISNASAQAQAIISRYQGIFGQITDAQMKVAQEALGEFAVANKQDYVIGYILGYIWSGRKDEQKPALTYTEMANARDLRKLLPKMPASGVPVLADVTVYLNLIAPVNSLEDQLFLGGWIRNQLRTNTAAPTERNGGMKLVNPNTGGVSPDYQVAYTINAAISQLQNDLNSDRSFSLSMQVSQASGSSLRVSVDGGAGFTVGSLLRFSLGTQFNYDMTTFQGTSTDCTVEIVYKGFTMAPIAASAWQQATSVGWFYGDPIAEAYRNQSKDVTGFKFVSTPPYNLGPLAAGGDFGMLTNLLISNIPTVRIHYRNANFSSFKQAWSESVSGNLTLFGFISLGRFAQGASGSSYKEGSSNSEFTVEFGPSKEVLSVPDLQKTAFPIGGSFDFPAVR
ncbi:MAG TPA: hypothetical protein VGM86_33565 [Thermoanaerobaculia bacterium]|jgi:hypothetical protein